MSKRTIDELQNKTNSIENFIDREKQIKQLIQCCTQNTQISAIYIYGPTGTGKTSIVKSVLNKNNCCTIYINCILNNTDKLIYSSICEQLNNYISTQNEINIKKMKYSSTILQTISTSLLYSTATGKTSTRDKISDITILLKRIIPGITIYIVLDEITQLCINYPTILQTLLSLSKHSFRSICLIVLNENYLFNMNQFINIPIIVIPFENYSASTLSQIIGKRGKKINELLNDEMNQL